MPHWIHSPKPVDYLDAVARMEGHVAKMHLGQAAEQIWFLEHPPLITAGASAKLQDLLQPDRFPVYETRRGGQYTYHGLGQLIGYVMLDLNLRGKDVRDFVFRVEGWLIRAFATVGLDVVRREGRIGLWVCQDGSEAKIAAVGLRIRKWISFHGFSVNVQPDLTHFDAIVPCGLNPSEFGVTSLSQQGITVTPAEFAAILQDTFQDLA